VWCGVVWCGVVWCGVVWCGVVCGGVWWCVVVCGGVWWCGGVVVWWCGDVVVVVVVVRFAVWFVGGTFCGMGERMFYSSFIYYVGNRAVPRKRLVLQAKYVCQFWRPRSCY
jgi:hypothetical protein